jgi:hypothetical protein
MQASLYDIDTMVNCSNFVMTRVWIVCLTELHPKKMSFEIVGVKQGFGTKHACSIKVVFSQTEDWIFLNSQCKYVGLEIKKIL